MILLLLVASVIAYIAWFYANVRRYPRGPTPLPFIGNLLQLRGKDWTECVNEFSKHYGPVFTVFMTEPHVVLGDFDAVKEALVTKGEHFIGKPIDPLMEYFAYVPNGGVFPSEGENWRHQRRIAISILRDMGMGKDLMEERVLESVRSLVKQLDGLENREDVDLAPHFSFCIANVINLVIFGFKFDSMEDYAKFDTLLNGIVYSVANLKSTFGWSLPLAEHWLPNVVRARKVASAAKDEYYDFIVRQVEAQERRFNRNEEPDNFVQAYLHEMAKGTNSNYNRDQVISVSSDMWMAGLITTIVTLRWAILCMTRYPDVQVVTSRMVAFGMGKRGCPGEALARMEVFLVFAALLQRYTFVREGPHTVPPATFFRDPGEYRCTIVPRVELHA